MLRYTTVAGAEELVPFADDCPPGSVWAVKGDMHVRKRILVRLVLIVLPLLVGAIPVLADVKWN